MDRHTRKSRIVLSWLAVGAVCAFIYYMSAKTGSDLDEHSGLISLVKAWLASTAEVLVGHPVDISPIGHFAEFFVLGVTLANALRWHLPRRYAARATYVLGSIYGALDEFHQTFVPTRTADQMDWIVDTLAVVTGGMLFILLRTSDQDELSER